MPMMGRGMSSRKTFVRCSRSRGWSNQEGSLPRTASLATPLAPWLVTCDPDAADAEARGLCLGVEVGPERLVELLGKAIRVGAEDGDVAWLGVGVVDGRVLLDREPQDVFLRVSRRARELAHVLGRDLVLLDVEGERHGGERYGRSSARK